MNHTEQQLDEMSLDQLRELALSVGATEAELEPPAPPAAQPRNPDGTFAAAEQPPVEEPPVEEPPTEDEPPAVYRREIDLGDGSGKQVFEGSTWEELADKLANAQVHASRKIRELNQKVKDIAPPPAPKPLTKDEEFVVSQQLQTEPSKAFELLFERHMGMPLAEFRQLSTEAKQLRSEKANNAAANAWVAANPEYHQSPANGQKMNAYINRFFGGVMTSENLNQAYADLKRDGLIQAKPAAPPQASSAPPPPTRRASNLPAGRSAAPPPAKKAPTQAELENMPLEDLKALANGGKQYGGW